MGLDAGRSQRFLAYIVQTEICPGPPGAGEDEYSFHYFDFRYVDGNGTPHPFDIDFYSDTTQCGFPTGPSEGYAINNSGFWVDGVSGFVRDHMGVNVFQGGVLAKDTNGNFTSKSTSGSTTTWTDTLGRAALILDKGSPIHKYKYRDSSGTLREIELHFQTWTVRTNFGCAGVSNYTLANVKLPSKIRLPNSQEYLFEYELTPGGTATETTARLKKVTLPTGGTYQYVYGGANYGINCNDGTVVNMTRTINDGANRIWTYIRAQVGADWDTTISDPASNDSVFKFNSYGQLLSSKFYAGTSTLLRTVNTTWAGNGTPASSTVYLENGSTNARTETTFDNYGNLKEVREYDWGSGGTGALLRRTTFVYLHEVLTNYISLNILNRVTSTVVYNGSSTIMAQAGNEYDNYTEPLAASGAVQHDSAFGTGYSTRGNLTNTNRWRNTDGAWPNTRFQYDDAGNVLKATDSAGHNTTIGYTDSWATPVPTDCSLSTTKAYPTSIKNHLQHETTVKYNSCTGAVASSTDPNTQTSSIAYDFLGRVLQTDSPDGGRTTLAYVDNPPTGDPLSMTSTTKITDTQNLITKARFDVLGRVYQQELTSDPGGATFVDVTYDALGRQSTFSNPHRTAGAPTDGTTTTEYDAVGRVTKVIPPDGSSSTNRTVYAYALNTVTVTDPAGKTRKTYSDALGRVTRVDEPNPDLGNPAVTTYTYDALDNLLSVTQSDSRSRTFTYNSLSQVLTSNTPEAGAVTNTYNSEGLLYTTTDARNITTTFNYDALHRVTVKYYSDTTLHAYFFYDETALENPIGRLTSIGTKEISGPWVTAANFRYDPMGRVKMQVDYCIPFSYSCYYITSGTYDLAGNLTSLNYPSGRKITYGYNTAAQLNRVTFDSWNSTAVNYNYWTVPASVNGVPGFHATGTPRYENFGNGLQAWQDLDNRLRPNNNSLYNGQQNFIYKSYSFLGNSSVQQVTDNLTAGRTQSFTYDHLNRLATAQSAATSGADCWGLQYGYDIWANFTSSSVTKCSAPTQSFSINANNRITNSGFSYDAAGNLLSDGSFTYQWDAENRMKSLNTTGATYTYDAAGLRVRKNVGSDSTEYIYFGGQAIAERNIATAKWTDYVYGGSRRLARAEPMSVDVRFSNDSCSGCGGTPVGGGDRNLFVNSITVGATTIWPNDASVSYTAAPCNRTENNVGVILCNGDMFASTNATGQTITVNAYGTPDYNVYPHMQLWVNGALLGEWDVTGSAQNYTVAIARTVTVRFTNDSCSGCGGTPVGGGDRNLFVNSITVGTTTIYPNDPSISYTAAPCNSTQNNIGYILCTGDMLSTTSAAGETITVNAYGSPDYSVYPHMQILVNGSLAGEWDVTAGAQNYTVGVPSTGLLYYHADHLGSARMLTNSNGFPVWEGTYRPFGEELNAQGTVNTYKFTGFERDGESGLDHTWFRKYSSTQGRWCSADPLGGNIFDPQSLNRYAYVGNDPINFVDPLGLDEIPPTFSDVGMEDWGCTVDGIRVPCSLAWMVGASGAAEAVYTASGWNLNAQVDQMPLFAAWGMLDRRGAPPSLTGLLFIGGGGQGGGGGGEAESSVPNTAALDYCTRTMFGVKLRTFVPSIAGQFGVFNGFGPDAFSGRGSFTSIHVANDARTYSAAGITRISGEGLTLTGGFTDRTKPFLNYTANDLNPREIILNQIHELGHSLSYITGLFERYRGTRDVEYWGSGLEKCFLNRGGFRAPFGF